MLKSIIKSGKIASIVFLLAFVLSGCPAALSPEETQPEETSPEETLPEETLPDSNAALSALVISHGTLSPAFSAEVTSYTTFELSTVASITVTPTAESDAAVIKVNGTIVISGAPSGNINLSAGPDTITIEVTAEDKTTTNTYIVAAYSAVGLPGTGQTTLYVTGDDGDLQRGVSWPDPRFTDNSDGTITDKLTGLMWDRTGDRFSQSTWAKAFTNVSSLTLAGYGDWRLPDRKELRSLVNYEESDQATWLNNQGFSNLQADFYWSSTTYRPSTGAAWLVAMDKGTVGFSGKTTGYYVLAVRSGQTGGDISLPKTGQTTLYVTGDDGDLQRGVSWPDPRFTDNSDGTITDKLTGLMWDRTGNRFGQNTWVETFNNVSGLPLAGYSDWRMPNVTELESLINAEKADQAAWLNNQGFSNLQADIYWSSTTYGQSTLNAWYVHMSSGSIPYNTKSGSSYVLAVRSGQ